MIQLVVFTLAGQSYALPLAAVERVLPMVAWAPLPQAPAVALGVINVHGRIIAVCDIRQRFGLPVRAYGLTDHLLVVRTRHHALALPVDQVAGVQEVNRDAIAPPAAVLPHLGHIAGLVSLPTGILLIQDLDVFLALDEEQQLTRALEEIPP
jgi:chemotaxis signal transduction protein